jgi:hypothetical protein
VKEFVESNMLVTVVFDCCFSAATQRNSRLGTAEVRYREYDPLLDTHGTDANHEDSIDEAIMNTMRNAKAEPQWVIDPTGYTIFCACTSEQIAESVSYKVAQKSELIPGTTATESAETTSRDTTQLVTQYRGALSYVLLEALKEMAITCTPVHDQILYRYMCGIFHAKVPTQNPTRYGNKIPSFFSEIRTAFDNKVTAVTKADNKVVLSHGEAHGIAEGDVYELFPLEQVAKVSERVRSEWDTRYSEKQIGAKDNSKSRDEMIARVKIVKGLTSEFAPVGWLDRAHNYLLMDPQSN